MKLLIAQAGPRNSHKENVTKYGKRGDAQRCNLMLTARECCYVDNVIKLPVASWFDTSIKFILGVNTSRITLHYGTTKGSTNSL